VTTMKGARWPRLWNAVVLIVGFCVGLLLLDLLGLVVAPLARFHTLTDVVFTGLSLLWLCGAWVAGTWLVTLFVRHVLHVHTTWFGLGE
jgi:hypothetical protein